MTKVTQRSTSAWARVGRGRALWAAALVAVAVGCGSGGDETTATTATTATTGEAVPSTAGEPSTDVRTTDTSPSTDLPGAVSSVSAEVEPVPTTSAPPPTTPATAAPSTSPVVVDPPSATWDGTYVDEPTSGALQIGHTGPRVAAMQRGLGAAGVLAGPFDGDFGPGTERALLAFQAQHGLPVDGIAGPTVLDAVASAGPAAPAAPTGGWTLRGDGLGDLRFGGAGGATTAALDAQFGAPTSTNSFTGQPISGGLYAALLGLASDQANAWIVTEPALQIRCYANGLCAYLGGASHDALAFRGWSLTGSGDGGPLPAPGLATADGVTLGSSTTQFPGLVRRTGTSCFASSGVADAAGSITVIFDDSWEMADDPVIPAPGTTLAVTWMSAGAIPSYGDGCS